MKQNEHFLQCACIRWFRVQYPQHLLFASANGGARNIIVAAKLKASGVLAGVPDLQLCVARNGFNGLFIELKYGKNKPTEQQLHVMECLEKQGYCVKVCWDFESFVKIIKEYLK